MALSEPFFRLRCLLRRKSLETELDEELRPHLEYEAEKYVKSGLSPEEARRRARIALGGVEQVNEECREARGVSLVESVARDVGYAARILRARPVFAALGGALGLPAAVAAAGTSQSLVWARAVRPSDHHRGDSNFGRGRRLGWLPARKSRGVAFSHGRPTT